MNLDDINNLLVRGGAAFVGINPFQPIDQINSQIMDPDRAMQTAALSMAVPNIGPKTRLPLKKMPAVKREGTLGSYLKPDFVRNKPSHPHMGNKWYEQAQTATSEALDKGFLNKSQYNPRELRYMVDAQKEYMQREFNKDTLAQLKEASPSLKKVLDNKVKNLQDFDLLQFLKEIY